MIPVGDDAPLEQRPIVTWALVVTHVAVTLYLIARAGAGAVIDTYGFAPAEPDLVNAVAAMVAYGGVLHLVFNMVYLGTIGKSVENAIGSTSYVLLYALGALAALGLYLVAHPDSPHPLTMATAAVGAVVGAYIVLYPSARIRFVYWAWFWTGSIFVPAWTYLAVWCLVEMIAAYTSFAQSGASPVGHASFASGVLFGAATMLPLRWMASRLIARYESVEADAVRLPPLVQQRAEAQWRGESSESGEIRSEAVEAWATQIDEQLDSGHASHAIRLYERHANLHAVNHLAPSTRYRLARACLSKGRYWRSATLLESLIAAGTPPKILSNSHALLAAVYGQHPYFHESAAPHLSESLRALPRQSPAIPLLHELKTRLDMARQEAFSVSEQDRFCLVRQTTESYRIAEAGPIVAAATRRDLHEVMRDLRNNRGILAWKQPREKALDLAAALTHAGIHVAVVPLSALQGYGKVEPLDHVSVRPEGVILGLPGETLRVAWKELALVTGGYLVLTSAQQQRVYEESRDAALADGQAMASFDSMVRELRHLTILDFWLEEPTRHLRVREHPLRMPESQLKAVASAILREAPLVPTNDGVSAIAKGVVPADCLFDRRDDFTYYGIWQLQLRQWDRFPPLHDSLIGNLVTALEK